VIPLVERYRDRLPLEPDDRIVTLYEGSTPLVHADALSKELGADIWLKLESMNPTGSFKDRGMTVAVSRAARSRGYRSGLRVDRQHRRASAAAYAGGAGMTAEILLPHGRGRAGQARAGARGSAHARRSAR
jgi:threonine synthase